MTYEHARVVTEGLISEGIQDFCVPASLDSVLRITSIAEIDYREAVTSRELSDAPKDQIMNSLEYLDGIAAKYFPGKETSDGWPWSVYAITKSEPFSDEDEDELSVPLPGHLRLVSYLDEISNKHKLGIYDDGQLAIGSEDVKDRIGLYIAIDNALRKGLNVLGFSGDEHVFGISREDDGKHYIFDVVTDENGSTAPIKKTGPLSLEEVCGLRRYDQPPMWPERTEFFEDRFSDMQVAKGEYHYALMLFPSEES